MRKYIKLPFGLINSIEESLKDPSKLFEGMKKLKESKVEEAAESVEQ